jgi:hypothetical protein
VVRHRAVQAAGATRLHAIAGGLEREEDPDRARARRMVRGVMRVLERLYPFVAESGASEANSVAA